MTKQKKTAARKDQILTAASKVFAQKGYHEATVSEIAREAGLSDATIYEYFSTKEELLFSIPEETTREGKETLEFHLNYVKGAVNRIRSMIYHYLWFYQENPEYASVALLILKQNRKFLETDAYQLVREWSRLLLRVVQEGIESGEFKPDTDPNLVRSVILGSIEHIIIRSLLLGKPKNLVSLADPLVDMIVGGIQTRADLSGWNLRVILEPPSGNDDK